MNQFNSAAELNDWLLAHGIDTSTWGQSSKTKTVANLWAEIQRGETRLQMDPPLRHVQVVRVLVRRGDEVLIEARQLFRDGRDRLRNRLPSEKLKPGEDPLHAARRCLEEEMAIPPEKITIYPNTYRTRLVETGSDSYPGLPCRYEFHLVEAAVPGLPSGSLSTEEQASGPGDPVSQHFWEWQPDKEAGQPVR